MSDLLVRNIDPALKRKLVARARENGRSLSAEAIALLHTALAVKEPQKGLGTELVELFRDSPIPDDFDMEIHDLPGEPIDFE